MTDVFGAVTGPVLLAGTVDGYPVIPTSTPLTRLNFFDGRLLSGADLRAEQQAGRELVFALGRTGGPGVAYGLDVDRAGERLTIAPGLAIDPDGRALLLTQPVSVTVAELLAAGAKSPGSGKQLALRPSGFGPCAVAAAPAPVATVAGTALYVLTAGWVEGLCGNAEVFGAACQTACLTPTDRPYRIDGIVFRLRPLVLDAPLPGSKTVVLTDSHLRSRVAAAYFADERGDAGPRLSAAVLASRLWCHGAPAPAGAEVPLAVLGRSGDATVFHDEWTARRERIDVPASAYLDGRIAARPRAVFGAQLAQFQCQLADVLPVLPADSAQALVDAGIVELPPFGYLQVPPKTDVLAEVRTLLGGGVDVRLVAVPEDQVPHELDAVRHRDRIPLLPGLDDPAKRVPVDVLVPDGIVGPAIGRKPTGRPVIVHAGIGSTPVELTGSGLLQRHSAGGFTVSGATLGGVTSLQGASSFVDSLAAALAGEPVTLPTPAKVPLDLDVLREVSRDAGLHAIRARADLGSARLFSARFTRDVAKPLANRATLTVEADPWTLPAGGSTVVNGELDIYAPGGTATAAAFDLVGRLQALDGPAEPRRRYRLTGQVSVEQGGQPGPVRSLRLEALVGQLDSGYEMSIVDGPVVTLRMDPELTLEVPGMLTLRLAEGTDDERIERGELALGLLRGAKIADAGFFDRARRAIFGALAGPAEAVMTTPHDWVAFRRRGVEPPGLPPVTTRPVVFWEITADNADEAEKIEQQLRAGQPIGLAAKRVGSTVLFRAGTAVLATSAADLRAAYQASGGAPMLRFAGFVPKSMPAGKGRADAVISALDKLIVTDAATSIDSIPEIPALMEPDTDGSLILVVHPRPVEVKTAILEIVGLDTHGPDPQAAKVAFEALRGRDSAKFQAMIGGAVQRLGTITFAVNQVDPAQLKAAADAASNAVNKKVVAELTPLLWQQENWIGQNPELADFMIEIAKKIVDGTRGQQKPPTLELRDRQLVLLDQAARNGLLIYAYQLG